VLEIDIDQPDHFYQEWKPEEMQQLVRDLDTHKIQTLIRSKHKPNSGGYKSTK
jgi:hypothetical protein